MIPEPGDAAELELLRSAASELSDPIDVIFHPATEKSALSSAFAAVARAIGETGREKIRVLEGHGSGIAARPGLTLVSRDHRRVHYLALPNGPEAAPFREALLGLSRHPAGSAADPAMRLGGLARPAELLVFIASTCPHCPLAVRAANRLAIVSSAVTTSIVDVQRYSELAERFCIRSVPTTILDEGLSVMGVVQVSDLVDRVLAREAGDYEATVFRSLVEANRLDEAAQSVHAGHGVTYFFSAWKESATSMRMGLLLTAEKVLELDPAGLDGLVPRLLSLLSSQDATFRGDTADLLGRIGHPAAAERLKALLDDPNPDVAEIASEALEETNARARRGHAP